MAILRLLLVAMMCAISIAHHPAPTSKALTFNFTGSAAAQVIQVTLDPDGRIVLKVHGHTLQTKHSGGGGGGVLPDIESAEEDVSTRTLVWIVLGLVLLLGVCTALPSRSSSSSTQPRHYWPGSLTMHGTSPCDG
jgi:hypothetical protein